MEGRTCDLEKKILHYMKANCRQTEVQSLQTLVISFENLYFANPTHELVAMQLFL